MAQSAGPATGRGRPRSDREWVLVWLTVLLGAVAVLAAWPRSAHLVGTVAGGIAVPLGLWTQFVSQTSQQRIITVSGMTAGGLGLVMGVAHGGFS